MESREKGTYRVIITNPAERRFYEILEYLYDNYPIETAEKIADELRDTAQKLRYQPKRGAPEKKLSHRSREYHFILFKRTPRADIKIIYYVDQASFSVYITDFFPTEMDNDWLVERNK